MKVVLLFSGGLDSTVLLYKLQSDGHIVVPVSCGYGQPHIKEVRYARDLVPYTRFYQLPAIGHLEVEDIPDGHYTDENMKATVFPNRNMLLISIATAVAISEKMQAVAYAAHAGDHTIYPDCRPEFVRVMKEVLILGNWEQIELLTPFIHMSKAEIVSLGAILKVPFEKTWSCYKGKEFHCGTCGTCVERKEAFTLANVNDPTKYVSS